MLQLQKTSLLVKFFNQISCYKDLKAKISCFFLVFFLFNPPAAGKAKLQKGHFVFDVTQAEEIQKSASTELQKWSENVVNVENCIFFFEGKLQLFISYLSEMKTVSMFYNSSLFQYFYSFFLLFFVLEIFKFKYDMFFVRNSAAISKLD